MAESSSEWLTNRLARAAEADQLAAASPDPRERVLTLRALIELVAERGDLTTIAELARILAAHARKHGLRSVEAGAWLIRADAQQLGGSAAEALASAQQAALAAEAAPPEEDQQALAARAAQASGTALRALGRDREAAAELRRALALGAPASEPLRAELTLARARLGEVGADLASELAYFASTGPAEVRPAAQLAHVEYLLAAGAIAAAELAARPLALRAETDRDAAFLALRVALEARRPDDALPAVQAHLARDPAWLAGQLAEGAAHELAGRAEPALQAFMRARDLAREAADGASEAEALTRSAHLLLRLGNFAQARTLARAVFALPASPRAQAGAHVALAACELAAGYTVDAARAFDDAAAALGPDPNAQAELALLRTLANIEGAKPETAAAGARDGRYAVYARLVAAERKAQAADLEGALGLLREAASADRLGGLGLGAIIDAVQTRIRAQLS